VDLFKTVSPIVTVVVLVCLLWPLNLPLLALAVKVRSGAGKLDYEGPSEYWWRCTLGSFGVAVMSLIMAGLLYGLIEEMAFKEPAGIIHLALLMMFVPAAAGYLFWALALEDFIQALSVLTIYLLLPGLLLLLVGWLTGWGKILVPYAPWLLSI